MAYKCTFCCLLLVCENTLSYLFHCFLRTSSDSGLQVVPSTQGLPEVGSSTCLDLQALDVQETRKMKDDSKIHHIVDDFSCKSRKKVCTV
jgi:hypothetical protein